MGMPILIWDGKERTSIKERRSKWTNRWWAADTDNEVCRAVQPNR